MLAAIEQERKVELFGEYMHRWFDLKRTAGFADPSKTRADEVLSVLKGAFWQSTDALFPIPSGEIIKNTSLIQNPGY
ncbi:SusD family protein [compost metagenome]